MLTRGLSSPSLLAEEPDPKRQKLGSDEVYVVLQPIGPAECNYYIYIVDLNEKDDSASLVRRNPAFRLHADFPGEMAIAVVNSTLYLFGGYIFDGDRVNWITESYSYRLSPQSDTCDIGVKDILNNRISPMIFKICNPRAVLIGGQICVFSCFLERHSSNFELYDPETNEWTPVPEPPIDYTNIPEMHRNPDHCEVKFYCVENLFFFISTISGSYFIDFSQPWNDRNWVRSDLPLPFHNPSYNTQPFLKDGSLVYTPSFAVYDVNIVTEPPPLKVPFRSYIGTEQVLKSRDQAIFLLRKRGAGERLRACIVEVGGFRYGGRDLPTDSALGFCLFKYVDDDDDDDGVSKDPTILNSRLFYLDDKIFTYDIHIIGVFPMQ